MNNEQPKHHHLIITLVIVLILGLAYILYALYGAPDTTSSDTAPVVGDQVVRTATLGLTPTSASVALGKTFTVDIILNTGGEGIYGVDINNLRFDPQVFQVVDADTQAAGTQIKAGTLMDMNVANTVDNTAGTIQFSQLASVGNMYTGAGTLASVTFKAVKTGTSDISFDFTVGSSIDTNVAGTKDDILSAVTGGSYVSTP